MKKLTKIMCSVVMTVTLSVSAVTSVSAAANTTVPEVSEVQAQAQATANYVLSQTDFTDIADTSKFYNASKNLLNAIQSGADCSQYTTAYLSSVKNLLNEDGSLNINIASYGYPNDKLAGTAYLLLVLGACGENATDFDGKNIVASFEQQMSGLTSDDFKFGYDPDTYENLGMNPYHLPAVHMALNSYASYIASYSNQADKVNQAMLSLFTADGFDYYGKTADNNGTVLPGFCDLSANEEFTSKINSSLTYMTNNFYSEIDGTTHTKYSYYDTSTSKYEEVDVASPDSTALALAFYSQYGKADYAAASYQALIANFKSATTPGAFTYYGTDDKRASQDALAGLVTYLHVLSGQEHPYNVKAQVEKTMNPEVATTDSQAPTAQTSTETKTSPKTGESSLPFVCMGIVVFAGAAFAYTKKSQKQA